MSEKRRATELDIPQMLIISNEEARNSIANFVVEPELLEHWITEFQNTNQRFPWLAATEDEEVVGFAKASPWKGRCAYQSATLLTP